MEECKNCKSTETVKNGLVRQKQRYKCKSCGHNFVCCDERRKKSTELKRITSVLLYSLGKASFRFLAKLFDVSPTTTYNWVRQTAELFGEPVVDEKIKEIEIDEMWHFLQSKKTKNGLSRPWIVTQGELSPGLSVVVMLQRHENYTTSSHI
jgi:transposase-like protein